MSVNFERDYAFYAKTVQANCIRHLCDVFERLLRDVNLSVDQEGIKIATMDDPRVAFVHLKLNADKFESYHCPHKKLLGVPMQELSKLIKSANHTDTITLAVRRSNDDLLEIHIDTEQDEYQTTAELPLLNIPDERCALRDVEFNYIITLPSARFQRLCREQHALARETQIISKPHELTFRCKGDASGQTVRISHECDWSGDKGSASLDTTVTETYSLKYLVNFSKAAALNNTVEIYIAEEYPLMLKFAVGTLGDLKLMLTALDTFEDE